MVPGSPLGSVPIWAIGRSFQQKGGLARQKQGDPSPEQPRGNVTKLVGRENPSKPARKSRQNWAQGKSRVAGGLWYGDSKETEALRQQSCLERGESATEWTCVENIWSAVL